METYEVKQATCCHCGTTFRRYEERDGVVWKTWYNKAVGSFMPVHNDHCTECVWSWISSDTYYLTGFLDDHAELYPEFCMACIGVDSVGKQEPEEHTSEYCKKVILAAMDGKLESIGLTKDFVQDGLWVKCSKYSEEIQDWYRELEEA